MAEETLSLLLLNHLFYKTFYCRLCVKYMEISKSLYMPIAGFKSQEWPSQEPRNRLLAM